MRREQVAWVIAGAFGASAAFVLRRRGARPHRPRPDSIESRWMDVGGIAVHARVSVGSVPPGRTPVVLVHGLGMSSRYMMPLARELAPAFPVYAPDLPGFGLSDKPERALSVAELAEALRSFMDAADLPRAVLVGNSLGCEILVAFARRHPERADRLVLQGPTPDPEARTPLQQVLLFCVTALFERWSLARVAASDYLRGGVRRYIDTFRSMIAHRIKEGLPEVHVPTLVVWGTRDYITPRRSVERMACLLPRGKLVVVPGAAHGMNYSHPDLFVGAILPFLQGAAEGREALSGVGGDPSEERPQGSGLWAGSPGETGFPHDQRPVDQREGLVFPPRPAAKIHID